jgi:hypothetical protein
MAGCVDCISVTLLQLPLLDPVHPKDGRRVHA